MSIDTHTIIRVPRDVHYQLKIIAAKKGQSIMDSAEEGLRDYIKTESRGKK